MHLYFARVLNPKPNHDYIVWAADLQPDGARRQRADTEMALLCLRTASVAPEHSSLSDTYAASTGAKAFCPEPSALELHIQLVSRIEGCAERQTRFHISGSSFQSRTQPKRQKKTKQNKKTPNSAEKPVDSQETKLV